MDNLLTWDGAALIASLMVGYDIDFMAIISFELHERAFSDMTTLSSLLCPTIMK